MARITPRVTPYIPKPQHLAPQHLIRGAVRGVATGNVPHPRVGAIRIPSISRPAAAIKPKLVNLTTATHSGRVPAPNPKPKSPSQMTGISTRPRTTTKLPSSAKAQQPGVHSLQGAKMKIHKANPLKLPKI